MPYAIFDVCSKLHDSIFLAFAPLLLHCLTVRHAPLFPKVTMLMNSVVYHTDYVFAKMVYAVGLLECIIQFIFLKLQI